MPTSNYKHPKMKEPLTVGLAHTATLIVTEQHTAERMGSGDMPVLATPALAALMENAAMTAVAQALDDGDTTVGSQLSLSHLRPSAIGASISATATLTAIDGRRLTFSIAAHESDTLIGEATHTRYVVTRDRFLSKLGK